LHPDGGQGDRKRLIKIRVRVLLIERRWEPFTGCCALPGGHVDPGEGPGRHTICQADSSGVKFSTQSPHMMLRRSRVFVLAVGVSGVHVAGGPAALTAAAAAGGDDVGGAGAAA
jgi:8-oxo-dGTP pyrophosphatase MutT (NUDIX family)